MENNYEDSYLLEYLDGVLNPSEMRAFERDLEGNQAIKERLNLIRFTIRAFKFKAYKASVREIQHDFLQHSIENKAFTKLSTPDVEPKARPIQFWLKMAATMLLLFTMGYALFLLQTDGEQLFENNYISYEIAVERGAGEQEIYLESQYINGEFSQMFQITAEKEKEEFGPYELLLLGTAALELNKPEEARQYLQKINADNDQNRSDTYQDEADFYMALTYLKQGAYEQALHYVRKIRSDQQHKFHANFSWREEVAIRLQKMR